jgi:predicted nuclease of predicted toxin-antitoxin system
VKVLVDAHLPKRLSEFLSAHQVESKHTLDLPEKNATPDREIIRFADDEHRIVISKDSDFLDNYILDGSPKKLLIVSTGNINNRNLIGLFEKNLETLKSLFEEHSVVEIDEEEIQVHY